MPIYFIQEGTTGPIKIGFSETVEGAYRRFHSFKVGNSHRLRLLRIFNGPIERERDFHTHFKRKGTHIRGEWFECDEELAAIIWGDFAEPPHDWEAQYSNRLPPSDIGICWPRA